jgi:hypothetical protein
MARALLYAEQPIHLIMLSRVAAIWLVALVLAPFTAPFPTCDLAALLGGDATQQAPGHLPASAIANDSIVASVPAIGSSRVRLTAVSDVFDSSVDCDAAVVTSARAAAPAQPARTLAGLAANLRV